MIKTVQLNNTNDQNNNILLYVDTNDQNNNILLYVDGSARII
jgi:hypothetical protein